MKVLAALLGVVGLLTVIFLGIEAVVIILFGWPFFLARVLPNVSPDGPTVIVGAVALLLFMGGIHLCGRRWVRSWRLRWTAMTVTAIGLLFGVGVAVIGITHQVAWLATADQPLTGPRLSRTGTSSSNMKYLGMGVQNYHDTFSRLPAGGTFAPDGQGKHGWVTPILPFFGYYARGVDMDRPWNDPANRLYFKCVIPELINPDFRTSPFEDAEGYGLAHYAANTRVMGRNTNVSLRELPDGGSGVVLVGEVNEGFRPWGHPENWRDPASGMIGGPTAFGNPQGTGASFLLTDGSVRFVIRSVDPVILEAMAGPKR